MPKTKFTPKPKTRAARTTKTKTITSQELDGTYFLKLVLYLVVGVTWIKITHNGGIMPIPVGLFVGLLFASHEHFQIDRKIEFAVLLVAMLVGYFAPIGIYISY